MNGPSARALPSWITLRVRGEVLGALAGELGTHVLIQRSASRGRAARKRWFAAVSLHARSDDGAGADVTAIPRDDLVITACRAGGPGGQHVNKVSSAVRIHHLPSGIAFAAPARVRSAPTSTRRCAGWSSCSAKRAEAGRANDRSARRHAHYTVERGRAVRSYQLDDDGCQIERSPA